MARYIDAVEWIASNDESAEMDLEVIQYLVTVQMVSDIWDKPSEIVAKDVLKWRKRNL